MTQDNDDTLPQPIWFRASIDDLEGLDFEAPLLGVISADCREISERYRIASQQGDGQVETASTRIFALLTAVTGMYFKPDDKDEPFGAMCIFDGRRSAITSDFSDHIELLAHLASHATNLALRARLCDVCWLLDRKQGKLGLAAMSAYCDLVEKIDKGELKASWVSENDGFLEFAYEAHQYLRRALYIGRRVGWDKPETIRIKELVQNFKQRAFNEKEMAINIIWLFCKLDLDFSISDPEEIGQKISALMTNSNLLREDLWLLAAHAFHAARRVDDENRCLSEAAEQLVLQSQAQGSAMSAAHWMSQAIAQLHGIPNKRDRRDELKKHLIDIQAKIPDELSTFSHEIDLSDIAERVQDKIEQADLLDALFIFAGIERSPDPVKLSDEAKKNIEESPLSSLCVTTSHMDREGKVISCSGAGSDVDKYNYAIAEKIAQNEIVRRKIVSCGPIQAARHAIVDKYYLSDDIFQLLLQHSPFISPDLNATFSRGFLRFFQGDFVSATYILTPLLENSLRHVLKIHNYDVSTFDQATHTQQDRDISQLFKHMRPELEKIFTAAIVSDIERVFLNKPGPHLRHAVAHGLLHDGDPYGADAIYGCWLIFRLCLIPLFAHHKKIKENLHPF